MGCPAPWPLPKDEPLLGPGLGMAPSPTRPAHCSFHGDPFGFLPKEDGFPLSVQVACLGLPLKHSGDQAVQLHSPPLSARRDSLWRGSVTESQSNIRHQHVLWFEGSRETGPGEGVTPSFCLLLSFDPLGGLSTLQACFLICNSQGPR